MEADPEWIEAVVVVLVSVVVSAVEADRLVTFDHVVVREEPLQVVVVLLVAVVLLAVVGLVAVFVVGVAPAVVANPYKNTQMWPLLLFLSVTHTHTHTVRTRYVRFCSSHVKSLTKSSSTALFL